MYITDDLKNRDTALVRNHTCIHNKTRKIGYISVALKNSYNTAPFPFPSYFFKVRKRGKKAFGFSFLRIVV